MTDSRTSNLAAAVAALSRSGVRSTNRSSFGRYGVRAEARPPKLEEVIIQDWCTRIGVTMVDYTFNQSADSWLQLDDRRELDVIVEILSIGEALTLTAVTGVTFSVQTAFSEEGPWHTIAALTSPTVALLRFTSDPNAPFPVARFIRYAIDAERPWQTTFRVTAYVPPNSGPLPFNEADNVHVGERLAPWTAYRGTVPTSQAGYGTTGIQSAAEYLATDELQYLVLQPEITGIQGATLHLEVAFGEDGPWRSVAAYTQPITADQVLLSEAPTSASIEVLGRFVRTRIDAPGTNWVACYRVNAKWS